ncbi:D-hexose-6-phosphate mutarotase [Pseudoalteromonas sp.]|uniref:D-hexose-6-phosphate mutarotase n=1 Tax=Pseudoalteromonas sp. TaxID=53249 RepID=UPI003563C099
MNLSPSVTVQQTDTGLEYISVDADFCSAKIFLQGAQLTEFTPKGKKPLIWVSQDEDYQVGKGVRGGIPICWPWFGMSANDGWPQHGIARTMLWRAEEVIENDEKIVVSFSLPMAQVNKEYWPHQSSLKVVFTLSDRLHIALINTNTGDAAFELTQALHTYFPTPEIENTTVDGLQGSNYIEFGEGPYTQSDIVSFARETDMVYQNTPLVQTINTPDGIIEVGRENSSSCVLWNPWTEKSKRLSNFRDDEYHTMLCLEAANVMDDKVTLQPGASHSLVHTVRWL